MSNIFEKILPGYKFWIKKLIKVTFTIFYSFAYLSYSLLCSAYFSPNFLKIAKVVGNIWRKSSVLIFYGIFFLVGKRVKYIGLNCPKCLKTILLKCSEDLFVLIKKNLSLPIPSRYSDKTVLNINPPLSFSLYYHSTPNFFSKDNPALKRFDIPNYDYVETYGCFTRNHGRFNVDI